MFNYNRLEMRQVVRQVLTRMAGEALSERLASITDGQPQALGAKVDAQYTTGWTFHTVMLAT